MKHMITNPFDFDTPAVPIVDGNIKNYGKEEIEDRGSRDSSIEHGLVRWDFLL